MRTTGLALAVLAAEPAALREVDQAAGQVAARAAGPAALRVADRAADRAAEVRAAEAAAFFSIVENQVAGD